MSHTSKIFEEAPIKVQNRNGFDLSHLNCGTSKCGQLVPVMCKLLPPNSKFTLGVNMEVSLPPLASPFYGRVDAICEGFAIPCSILYGGWKQFVSNQQFTMFPSSQDAVLNAGGYAIPYFDATFVSGASGNGVADWSKLFDLNDNLYEFLGVRQNVRTSQTIAPFLTSLLPALAYHLCWDTWYRNKNVTKTIFSVNPSWHYNGGTTVSTSMGYPALKNVSLIWHSFYSDSKFGVTGASTQGTVYTADPYFNDSSSLTFPDGISVFSTRQRNWARDYFTAASVDPQQGSASGLRFSIEGSADAQGDVSGNGEFTIASLRAANALQKFLETNNLSGDYAETMRNRWGVKPIDADFDEPYYLGRVVVPVYQHTVAQTASQYIESDSEYSGGPNNVFTQSGLIGSKAASGGFRGKGSIADSYVNSTWSYVMVLFSLVPHAMYGYGFNRELLMREIGDFPAPELQSIGYEEIKSYELYYTGNASKTYGYIPRYSRFKYMDDEIHGEMRPGKTLDKFVLQRQLVADQGTDYISLSTSFLEIPQDALDGVLAVKTSEMKLSCWYEIFFEFKVSMPLADFCIPTLGELGDTHTIKAPVGGSRL